MLGISSYQNICLFLHKHNRNNKNDIRYKYNKYKYHYNSVSDCKNEGAEAYAGIHGNSRCTDKAGRSEKDAVCNRDVPVGNSRDLSIFN